ncbi:MAG: hypothetical protein GIW97_07145, partial [Candidatus Eremiobacteraeota bacterium]|nr:hypothetical protein [Candidatus Eremiobacteraeota bacterium]
MAFARRAFGLSVLAVFLIGAAPKSPPLHQLVALMRAASGDPYRYHITSTAHEKDNDNDVSISADFFGLQFLTRRCDGALCSGTYFDGSQLFSINMNDTALPATGEPALKAIRYINSGMFLSPDFARAGGVLTDMAVVRSEGKAYRAIGVKAPSAAPMYVLADPQTFLVSGVRDFKGAVSFDDRDYRRVGPLMLPFSIYQNGVAVQQYDTRMISTTPLTAPHGLQPHFRAPPLAVPILQASDAPIIPCTLARVET